MGGSVAVTVRRENGELIKMCRRTGSYSFMFTSKDFNNGNVDKAIDNYKKNFDEMREDYLNNSPNKFEMSSVYGWCQEMAPVDYGLVFIDTKDKEIHSMQGYDMPGSILISSFSSMYMYEKEEIKERRNLIENNQLVLFSKVKNEIKELGSVKELFGEDLTYKKFKKIIDSLVDNEKEYYHLIGNNSLFSIRATPTGLKDYKIVRYEESVDGASEFAKTLLEKGFTFNDAEKKLWLEFISCNLENRELDELTDIENTADIEDSLYQKLLDEAREAAKEKFMAIVNQPVKSNKLTP